jgi:hypothetical protein
MLSELASAYCGLCATSRSAAEAQLGTPDNSDAGECLNSTSVWSLGTTGALRELTNVIAAGVSWPRFGDPMVRRQS